MLKIISAPLDPMYRRFPFSCSFVTPRIGVGPAIFTEDYLNQLHSHGITHIIDLWEIWNDADFGDDRFQTIQLAQLDDMAPRTHTIAGIAFALAALSQPGTKLYVHCHAGRSRSPAMAYAIIRSLGVSADAASRMFVDAGLNLTKPYVEDTERYLSACLFG